MTKKKSSATADTTEPTPFQAYKNTRLVVSSANYDYYRDHLMGEPGGGVSETVPGGAMGLEEILFKFSQGMPMDSIVREGSYTENEYIPNFRAMDIEEIRQYRADIDEIIKSNLAGMDAATRELAIRDGVMTREQADLVPLPPDPEPVPEPPAPEPPATT